MTAVIVVGAQWGDEGKGKIIDFLASKAEMVVRCQGGSNAGHTVVCGKEIYKLHLVPSGILYPGVTCVIANGVVIDIDGLLQELSLLKERGIASDNLYISDRAQIIFPYHREMDKMQEELKGVKKIGTTKKGIGPAYVDKYARSGLRIADLFHWDSFRDKLCNNVREKNVIFKAFGYAEVDEQAILDEFVKYQEELAKYVTDTSILVNAALDAKKRVLFEGAQGTLLDIDHGTYPYVTSSYPTAGGVCTGAGVGPTKIDKVVGVVKAYTTRVGDGPFPTELFCEIGATIREKGFEFGTTTGRPRRCGWLDTVVLNYSNMVNGLTDLAVTKLDVLDDLEEIKICTAYRYRGQILPGFPADLELLEEAEPLYEVFPGWRQSTENCRSLAELPEKAQNYLRRVEELGGVRISFVAVGAERDQTIAINEIF